MSEDLTQLSDEEIARRIQYLTEEQGRRIFLQQAKTECEIIVSKYESAMEKEDALPIQDVPINEAIGPGAGLIDEEGVEWINQSGAWLSPHSAGPDKYPMGWRMKNPPEEEVKDFIAGEWVEAGELRRYNEVVYKCIQAHTTDNHWPPPSVPALWSVA